MGLRYNYELISINLFVFAFYLSYFLSGFAILIRLECYLDTPGTFAT